MQCKAWCLKVLQQLDCEWYPHMQMSSTVSNGLGFASYETGLSMFRQLNEGVTPGPAERGIIAGGAAVTVMAAIQPLEVCCRRMQVCFLPSCLYLTWETYMAT